MARSYNKSGKFSQDIWMTLSQSQLEGLNTKDLNAAWTAGQKMTRNAYNRLSKADINSNAMRNLFNAPGIVDNDGKLSFNKKSLSKEQIVQTITEMQTFVMDPSSTVTGYGDDVRDRIAMGQSDGDDSGVYKTSRRNLSIIAAIYQDLSQYFGSYRSPDRKGAKAINNYINKHPDGDADKIKSELTILLKKNNKGYSVDLDGEITGIE